MILLFIRPLKEKKKWKEDFLSFLSLFYESLGERRGGVYLSGNGVGWVAGGGAGVEGKGGRRGREEGEGEGERGRWGKKGRWWEGRDFFSCYFACFFFSFSSSFSYSFLFSFLSILSFPNSLSCSHSLPLSFILSPSPSPSPYLSPTLSPYPLPPPPLCLVERYPPVLFNHPSKHPLIHHLLGYGIGNEQFCLGETLFFLHLFVFGSKDGEEGRKTITHGKCDSLSS